MFIVVVADDPLLDSLVAYTTGSRGPFKVQWPFHRTFNTHCARYVWPCNSTPGDQCDFKQASEDNLRVVERLYHNDAGYIPIHPAGF
jgi:hypothetical protein